MEQVDEFSHAHWIGVCEPEPDGTASKVFHVYQEQKRGLRHTPLSRVTLAS
jgi:hypothetical protein